MARIVRLGTPGTLADQCIVGMCVIRDSVTRQLVFQGTRTASRIASGELSGSVRGLARIRLVALSARQKRPEPSSAPFDRHNPGPYLPGWRVPNVLGVTALELGDPVPVHILSKADNASFGHTSLASEEPASVEVGAG